MCERISEEETFRRLKRLDFVAMDTILTSLTTDGFRAVYRTAADMAVFFLQFGWTVEEFEKEKRKRLGL